VNVGDEMDSRDLGHGYKPKSSSFVEQFISKFSEWHPLIEEGIEKAPDVQGAYVLRRAQGQRFGRLRGESDIMYIGSSEGKHGLRRRLRFFLHPGRRQLTSQRINEMAKKYEMEVAWCPCDEARNLEHQLLQRYVLDHDELPPLNHAEPRQLKKILIEALHVTDSLQVR
jgi:hypothetical protein